jgi:hypothetical protein
MPNVEEKASAAADATTGAAAEAVDAATDPAARVRRLVRRGGPINQDLARQAEKVARDTARTARQVLDGTIPERVARTGLRVVKTRARRRDLVGVATYRTLELVHEGVGTAARALTKLEEATQPPARQTAGGAQRPAAGRTADRPGAKARTTQDKTD